MIAATAKNNCWTCKERKVGCDRTLPSCINCIRASRLCKGYGLKLAWPDKYDGRRKQKKYSAQPDSSATHYFRHQNGEFVFLNTGFDDLEGKRVSLKELVEVFAGVRKGTVGCVPKSLEPHVKLGEREATLLGYYDTVVARMITTIDDCTNGFRLGLIPMALSTCESSSTSLLQATLALASFHMGNHEEALKYKVGAIKTLSQSFQNAEDSCIAQFSACMMLCVYSVFDASDTSWHLHLQGAKKIAHNFLFSNPQAPWFDFLASWFKYHQTFSEFTHPARFDSLYPSVHDIVLPQSTAKDRKIVGLLGCSCELLSLIACINQLRTLRSLSEATPESHLSTLGFHLRTRLLNLQQEVFIVPGEAAGTISHQRIHLTAQFYLLAAILYLYDTCPACAPPLTEQPDHTMRALPSIPFLVRQCFMLLKQMDVCTSPWPLFILASNVVEDGDRIEVMRAFERGARERKVGNYEILTGLVKAIWKREDLCADEGKESRISDWRDLIDGEKGMPSFI